MADSSHAAKTLVIKAEDARILGDIAAVRSCYAQLYTLNAELIGEYNKRANNHEQARAPRPKPPPNRIYTQNPKDQGKAWFSNRTPRL